MLIFPIHSVHVLSSPGDESWNFFDGVWTNPQLRFQYAKLHVDDTLRDYFAVLEHVQMGTSFTKTLGVLGISRSTFWRQRPIAEMFIADRWEFENILRGLPGDSCIGELSRVCKVKLQESPSREKADLLRSVKKLLP